MAALAGMSRETFNSAITDNALKDFILKEQDEAQKKWGIDSTPTFIINGQKNRRRARLRDLQQARHQRRGLTNRQKDALCPSASPASASPGSRASPSPRTWRSARA